MINFNKVAALCIQGSQKKLPGIEQQKIAPLLLQLLCPVDIAVEGIFRVAGNRKVLKTEKPLIDQLVDMFTHFIEFPGQSISIETIEKLSDELKTSFELDEGNKVHNRILLIKAVFIAIAPTLMKSERRSETEDPHLQKSTSKQKRQKETPDLTNESLKNMSSNRRFILSILIQFLRHVASASEQNAMTARNLAKIFAGTLQGPRAEFSEVSAESRQEAKDALDIGEALESNLLHLINQGSDHLSGFIPVNFENVEAEADEADSGEAQAVSETSLPPFIPRPILFRVPHTNINALYGNDSHRSWV